MFYIEEELKKIGFKKIGKNVSISDKCSIYSPHLIEIGNNVRIDDFTILSPSKKLIIGNHVHISCFCFIVGKEDIIIEDFVGIASRSALYSSSDNFSGHSLTGPTLPPEYTGVISKPVILEKHTIVGTGSTILPGCVLQAGTALYAHSLLANTTTKPFCIYKGTPAVYIKDRSKNLLNLEEKFKQEYYI